MKKIKRIINIEDSMGKHWDINRALSWNGYPNAELASNAEQGLEMIEIAIKEGNPYELLITDMYFSVHGAESEEAGLYVIEELKKRNIQMPIIVCSSLNYNIPEITGCVFYNKSKDLSWEFREVLNRLS